MTKINDLIDKKYQISKQLNDLLIYSDDLSEVYIYLDNIQTRINNLTLVNNNSPVMVMSKEDSKSLNDIDSLLMWLDEYIKGISRTFSIFKDIDKYEQIVESLNQYKKNSEFYIGNMNYDIDTLYKSLSFGLKEYLKQNEFKAKEELETKMYKVIFNFIKLEYHTKYKSLLIDDLIALGHEDKLIPFLEDSDVTDVKSAIKEIVLSENNLREKITNDLVPKYEESKELKQIIEKDELKIHEIKTSISRERKKSLLTHLKIYPKILSALLSLGIITGAGVGTYSVTKGFLGSTTHARLDTTYYSTIDGEYTTSDYVSQLLTNINEDKLLKIYFAADENGYRKINTYKITVDKDNMEDYTTLDLTEADLVSSVTKKDDEINAISLDEFRVVEFPSTLDYNDTIEVESPKILSIPFIIFFELLLTYALSSFDEKYELLLANAFNKLIEIMDISSIRINISIQINEYQKEKFLTKEEAQNCTDMLERLIAEYNYSSQKYGEFDSVFEKNNLEKKLAK